MAGIPSRAASNTRTIARNSVWYGVELVSVTVAAFITSIVVARAIGSYRLAPYQTVAFMANITGAIGGAGIFVTTTKYMAEYLNRGEAGIACSIYRYALRLQAWIGIALTAGGIAAALRWGEPSQRLIYILLVMSVLPRMIGFIPSGANNAAEALKRNTGPALAGSAITTGLTLIGIRLGWDLYGIAIAFSAGCAIEAALKLRSVQSWLGPITPVPIPPELKRRMLSFSGKGIGLMILNIVVWDRSDLLILRYMNADIRQVTFFSITFGLTERILLLPSTLAAPLSATMMAQFGRSRERFGQIAVTGTRYAALMAVPLLLGMACVSRPFVLAAYGKKDYELMIPVLAIAAMMAIPKVLSSAPMTLLQTVENQNFLIRTGCLCGALDIFLDFVLTPSRGAAGAAFANGLAQTVAAVAVWIRVGRDFQLDLQLKEFGKIVLCGLAMVLVVLPVQHFLVPGFLQLILSVAAGVFAWFAALRLTRTLTKSDADRLQEILRYLPHPVLRGWGAAFLRGLSA